MPTTPTGGPPECEKPAHTPVSRPSAHNTDDDHHSRSCAACAIDEPCVCQLYLDWEIWTSDPSEPVSAQLRRRREASWRCGRLPSGVRDPISASRW